jgi:hypothetical protein
MKGPFDRSVNFGDVAPPARTSPQKRDFSTASDKNNTGWILKMREVQSYCDGGPCNLQTDGFQ